MAATFVGCASLLVALGIQPVLAQQIPSPGQQVSAEELAAYGKYLSETCGLCHNLDGKDTGVPSITGWPEDAFKIRIEGYRSGDLENTEMIGIARALDQTDINALALYLSTLEKADNLKAHLQPGSAKIRMYSGRANALGSAEEALKESIPMDRRAVFCSVFQCSAAFLASK